MCVLPFFWNDAQTQITCWMDSYTFMDHIPKEGKRWNLWKGEIWEFRGMAMVTWVNPLLFYSTLDLFIFIFLILMYICFIYCFMALAVASLPRVIPGCFWSVHTLLNLLCRIDTISPDSPFSQHFSGLWNSEFAGNRVVLIWYYNIILPTFHQ